jgi:hypothetical protein
VGARPKFPYIRNKVYLAYVARHACFCCGIEGFSQAAHSNQARHGKGGRIKASDEFTWPLCCERPGHMGCHKAHDLCIDMSKDERDELENQYIQRMHAIAWSDGWAAWTPIKRASRLGLLEAA